MILSIISIYSYFTIRFLKDKRDTYRKELSKANVNLENKQELLDMLKTALANKPVALLRHKDKNTIKNTFEVKQEGDIKCRVKSSIDGKKRITVTGELAFVTAISGKYLPARDLATIFREPDSIAINKLYNVKVTENI